MSNTLPPPPPPTVYARQFERQPVTWHCTLRILCREADRLLREGDPDAIADARFLLSPESARLAKRSRPQSTTRPCKRCGVEFVSLSINAKYCDTCRPQVQREQIIAAERRRRRADTAPRIIGTTAVCADCQAEFTRRAKSHVRCASCAAERLRVKRRENDQKRKTTATESRP